MRSFRFLLYPISFLYGFIMFIRNLFFDLGLLKSREFPIPIIAVGNLSMGGTGKTPHVEYLIRLFQKSFNIATLSRGYGRTTKGFITATGSSLATELGDEPSQYHRKFQKVVVAVDESRCRGVQQLMQQAPKIQVILLDDAFQHRYVKPGLSILLSEYYHLYTEDHVVPAGNLREFRSGAKRADVIVITKTPKVFSPITRRRIIEEIKPLPHQKVFFSFIRHLDPVPFNDDIPIELHAKFSFILLFTGIADNELLLDHLHRMCNDLTTITFKDHHTYTLQDLERIQQAYESLPTQRKLLVTTEKDAMRLNEPQLKTFLAKIPLYYIPIEVDFHEPDKLQFDQFIQEYVKKNKRDS